MKIALSYAMPGEIESLLRATGAACRETVSGVSVYDIHRDILAYAGGVGKVNAAMAAQLIIDRYHPDLILNAGVAGSFADLPIGTVVLADSFVQHDVDTTPMGDPIGLVSTVNRVVFPTSRLPLACRLLESLGVDYRTGRVATGEVFLTKGTRAAWIAETFAPTLCEMEGGAVAQVCLRNGVEFMALKSVSDRLLAEDNAAEFFNFGAAMEALNKIVLPFAQLLREEQSDG